MITSVLGNDLVLINFKTLIKNISRCLLGKLKGGFLICSRSFLWSFSVSQHSVFEGMSKVTNFLDCDFFAHFVLFQPSVVCELFSLNYLSA